MCVCVRVKQWNVHSLFELSPGWFALSRAGVWEQKQQTFDGSPTRLALILCLRNPEPWATNPWVSAFYCVVNCLSFLLLFSWRDALRFITDTCRSRTPLHGMKCWLYPKTEKCCSEDTFRGKKASRHVPIQSYHHFRSHEIPLLLLFGALLWTNSMYSAIVHYITKTFHMPQQEGTKEREKIYNNNTKIKE